MTTHNLLRLLLFFLALRPLSSATHRRRLLHQPFQPQDASPPSKPPIPSPPKYPFSNSTPAGSGSPFFPSSPPQPPSSQASFPANVSSLTVPRSSGPHSVSTKLIIAAIAAVVSAVAVVSLAAFLHIRRRARTPGSSSFDRSKTQRSDSSSTVSFSNHLQHIPKLQRPPQTSSEFLYLGTLVSSHAPGAAFNNVTTSTATANNHNTVPTVSRKPDSPELSPLPPLNTSQVFRANSGGAGNGESEEFYSPKGESSIGTRSASRRTFTAINVENFNVSSSVAGSGPGSPAKSVSSRNSIPESPYLIEIQTITPSSSSSAESSPRISEYNSESHSPVIISTAIPTPPEIRDTLFPEHVPSLSYSRRSEEPDSSPRNSRSSDVKLESPASGSSPVNSLFPTPPETEGFFLPEHPPSSSPPERYTKSPPRIPTDSYPDITIEFPTPPPPEPRVLTFQESTSSPEICSTKFGQSSPRNSNVDSPERIAPPQMQNAVFPDQKSPTYLLHSPEKIQHNVVVGAIPPPPPLPPSKVWESPKTLSPPSKRLIFSPGSINPLRTNFLDSPTSTTPTELHSDLSVKSPMRIQHSAATFIPTPPPLPGKLWGSPRTPTPPAKKPFVPPSLINPLKPISLESPTLISPMELTDPQIDGNGDDKEHSNKETEYLREYVDQDSTFKPKLKQLHWDKVRASSDREMVWDQFKSSSFKLNEEMIETLFVANTPKPKPSPSETIRWQVLSSPGKDNGDRVLDPKKAQNIAILLKALHVTVDEVCEGLLEGNSDVLGTDLLESLLKMAPNKEEERKLQEYKEEDNDSQTKLGAAERFLKAVVDIPYAFKRVDAMLYVSNFDSDVEFLKKSFATLECACEELRSSRMFLKLLEAVLKTGNRMNVGTNRGDAHAFKLDTLLKLADVKAADGKTTLLHFVVQEIIRTEGLQVVSSLSSELSNVKKAAVMDSEVLSADVLKLSKGIENVREMIGDMFDGGDKFSENMRSFTRRGEEEIFRVRAEESLALSLVKEITEYFHGDSGKEEAHPFRIFVVVREFLGVLGRVCKEVGMVNERTVVSSAHTFPVPVNPMLQQASGTGTTGMFRID